MSMERNIVLVGMPGAGKSTLGVLLAKALGMDFADTDIAIQQHDGRLLQAIIDREGIDEFLEIEEKIVTGLRLENSVIATGGSVIYSDQAMQVLKQRAQIMYLHVSYEEIETAAKHRLQRRRHPGRQKPQGRVRGESPALHET